MDPHTSAVESNRALPEIILVRAVVQRDTVGCCPLAVAPRSGRMC